MTKKLHQNQLAKEKKEHSFLSLAKIPLIQNGLIYAILLFLPTQLGKHFWPESAFVYGIRIDYLSPTLYVTDILLLLLAVTLFLETLLSAHKNFKFQISNFKLRKNVLLLTAFLGVLVVGILQSKSPENGWYGLLKLGELLFLGMYVAYKKNLVWKYVVGCFAAGLFFESVLALLQVANGGSLGGIWYYLGERTFTAQTPGIANAVLHGELVLRPYATFPHPNVLAAYIVFCILLFVFQIRHVTARLEKITLSFLSLLGALVLFLTLSRAAILLLVASPLLLGRRYLRFLIVLYVGGFLLFLASPLKDRFFDIAASMESFTDRGALIGVAFAMIRDHMLFGVGLNNFLVSLPLYTPIGRHIALLQPVHNIFLLLVAQVGIFGTACLLFFIKQTIQKILLHQKGEKLFLFVCLFCIVGEGAVDHYFLTLQQGQLLLTLFLGLCWRSEVFAPHIALPKTKKLSNLY